MLRRMVSFLGLAFFLMTLSAPTLLAQVTGFPWKMAVVKTEKGKDISLPFSRPLTFVDNDQFHLVIVPGAAGAMTVLYEDTTGAVMSLFQGSVKENQLIILPGEFQAFEVSPPGGTEKFHIVIGTKAQASIDGLIKALPNSSSKMLDAVANLKTAMSAIAEAPEKPVPMGGTHRGLADATMTEFKGKDTYVKTIRFDH